MQSIGTSEEPLRTTKLEALKGYCEEQSSRKSGENVSFHDVIAQWNIAIEANNESLLSTIPSVLALLLRVISTELEFRNYGLSLCKDLLQKDQLRLLDRGLTATKTKEHLISPCLRLLTEVVSFDAGEVADLVYSRRESTLRRLEQFLIRKPVDADDKRKGSKTPSLRRIAQRYVIANIKYQGAKAKGELISEGSLLRTFLQGIKDDEGDIVLDILDTLEQNILKDASLTRNFKHRFLTYTNLTSLTSLYAFEDDSEEISSKVQQHTHKILRLICTSQEHGILRRQTGWYPLNSSPETRATIESEGDHIDLGLESPVSLDVSTLKNSIRNTQLSGFAQSLRPDTNAVQMELLLDIFRAAPEIVAEYFSKKTTFTTDPKPTAQWLGQSALIFSTIQLPVPENCGWTEGLPLAPPPTDVVIESILPRPLDKATLVRCLNLNNEIFTLFATRALSAAFRKLGGVLSMFQKGPEPGLALWHQAATKLQTSFIQRCPAMKDVIAAYHRTSKSDPDLHEAVIELLALYFKH